MTTRNTDHVVIDSRTQECVCKHCGVTHKLTLPAPIGIVVAVSRAFIKEHEHCKPKAAP